MIQTISSILRWTIFLPILIIGLSVLIIFSFINLKIVFWFSRPFCWILAFILGAKVKVEGEFPTDEKLVVMSNHSSFFDTFIYPLFMKGMFTGIDAEYNLKQVIKIDPNKIEVYNCLSNIYTKILKYNEAEKIINQAITTII